MRSLDELYFEYASTTINKTSKLKKGSTSNSASKRRWTKSRTEFEALADEFDAVETAQSELKVYLKESCCKCDELEYSFNN